MVFKNNVRKHQGIIQVGKNKGKLKKGFRYNGNKTKSGLPVIIKTKLKKKIVKNQFGGYFIKFSKLMNYENLKNWLLETDKKSYKNLCKGKDDCNFLSQTLLGKISYKDISNNEIDIKKESNLKRDNYTNKHITWSPIIPTKKIRISVIQIIESIKSKLKQIKKKNIAAQVGIDRQYIINNNNNNNNKKKPFGHTFIIGLDNKGKIFVLDPQKLFKVYQEKKNLIRQVITGEDNKKIWLFIGENRVKEYLESLTSPKTEIKNYHLVDTNPQQLNDIFESDTNNNNFPSISESDNNNNNILAESYFG